MLHVTRFAVDADGDLQLSRRHQLGLSATDVGDRADEIFLQHALREVMTRDSIGMDLRPAQLFACRRWS